MLSWGTLFSARRLGGAGSFFTSENVEDRWPCDCPIKTRRICKVSKKYPWYIFISHREPTSSTLPHWPSFAVGFGYLLLITGHNCVTYVVLYSAILVVWPATSSLQRNHVQLVKGYSSKAVNSCNLKQRALKETRITSQSHCCGFSLARYLSRQHNM